MEQDKALLKEPRVIIRHTPLRGHTFGISAAKWLLEQKPEQKDAILTYGDHKFEDRHASFYVRRIKSGVSVTCFHFGELLG